MASASIGKILVTNATGLSLNDRFTAIAVQPAPKQSRFRNQASSLANNRLLEELSRKDKMQAALKLKRRSMRPRNQGAMKRGVIKALRVAPGGKPIKANSLARFATMNADFVSTKIYNRANRPLRRSNSIVNRLGINRETFGGAAQRIANRNMELYGRGGRLSRSRSRSRLPMLQPTTQLRQRSVSRGRLGAGNAQFRQRSVSRGRLGAGNIQQRPRSVSRGRNAGRSRSRNRVQNAVVNNVPIQARLGIRSRGTNIRGRNNRAASTSRGVAAGRIQKRSNSTVQQRGNIQNRGATAAGGRVGRARGRSITRNATNQARSRSRRKGSVGRQQLQNIPQQQQQQRFRPGGAERGSRRRGRSQQRNGRNGLLQNKGKITGAGNNGQQQQQQQVRGRSRSRGASRGGTRNSQGRNLGKATKPDVNRDDLDKELDQYMATTRTNNDMDYLLKD